MPDKRVLVVGTTTDYITLLASRFPGRLLFVTDLREAARRSQPVTVDAEMFCDLERPESVLAEVKQYARDHDMRLSGVACFDCESLALAAQIAAAESLPFPSLEAIDKSRSKWISKKLWHEAGVDCPGAALVKNAADAVAFFKQYGRPIIVKPLSGSGSELVQLCGSDLECIRAFHLLRTGLADHPNQRMYPAFDSSTGINPREVFVAEEYISGREFSCDFILDGGRCEIIRVARKIYAPNQPTGTVLAYVVPARLPGHLDQKRLRRQLEKAARALGLRRTMAMVDFIVRDDKAYLLELTPRPGGDCLPPLIEAASGFDILGAALDFAEGRPLAVPTSGDWRTLVGLRLIAGKEGTLTAIDVEEILDDKRVISCEIKRSPGHRVILPPDDYDSRFLGHVIFNPPDPRNITGECLDIAAKLRVTTEVPKWMPVNQ